MINSYLNIIVNSTIFPLSECSGIASLVNDKEIQNNNNKAESSSGGCSTSNTQAKDVIDSLKNDTLDVLDCSDFVKVVSDCAEDCINLITDYLQPRLAASDTKNKINHQVCLRTFSYTWCLIMR